ncbi:hypothetical protein LRP88_12084 [Fusarium phalaenopsidis]
MGWHPSIRPPAVSGLDLVDQTMDNVHGLRSARSPLPYSNGSSLLHLDPNYSLVNVMLTWEEKALLLRKSRLNFFHHKQPTPVTDHGQEDRGVASETAGRHSVAAPRPNASQAAGDQRRPTEFLSPNPMAIPC